MQNLNNSLVQIQTFRPDIKVDRIFGIDEFWEAWYGSQRYYNKLVGGRLTGEFNIAEINSNEMLNATGFEEFWNGASSGPTYKTSFETPSEDKFIEVNSENIHASIKPNPSNGVFNLEFESYLNQDIEIKVVDLYGNIYYKIDKDKYNKGYYSKTINLGNMSNGSYFVNLSGDKSNITIPIIIMK